MMLLKENFRNRGIASSITSYNSNFELGPYSKVEKDGKLILVFLMLISREYKIVLLSKSSHIH